MIHKGVYGNDRFLFDIILCDNNPKTLKFRDKNNLPKETDLIEFSNQKIF